MAEPQRDHLFEGQPDARQGDGERVMTAGELVFRKRYRQLEPDEVMLHDAIKDTAAQLYDQVMRVPGSPERTLATRSIELAVFWAVKSLTGSPQRQPSKPGV